MDDRLNRHGLADAEWALREPLLPRHPRQGHRWNDHRVVIDGVFHRVRAGCQWRDLPGRVGDWKTAYKPHRRRSRGGTWEEGLDTPRTRGAQAGGAAGAGAAGPAAGRARPPPPR